MQKKKMMSEEREFHIWTGSKGWEEIDKAIWKHGLETSCLLLFTQDKIDQEEYKGLKRLLTSPDTLNWRLVSSIIEAKTKEDELKKKKTLERTSNKAKKSGRDLGL